MLDLIPVAIDAPVPAAFQVEHKEQAGLRLHSRICDSGIGTMKEEQQVTFSAFKQADLSTLQGSGGSGLGLCITAQLLEVMGGCNWIESTPGVESTLHFTPAFELAAQNDDSFHAEPIVPAASKTLFPCGILLVEANPIHQKVASAILSGYGYKVVIAISGKEALATLARSNFELILMDIQMPDMNGYQAARAIRQREIVTGGYTPIFAMTANVMEGDRERCLDAGMNDYLSKPIDIRRLGESIERSAATLLSKAVASSASDESCPKNDHVKEPETIFDRVAALQRLRGSETLLNDVSKMFLDQGPELMNNMRQAAKARDLEWLERLAHTLKGSAGVLAARDVGSLANQIEQHARRRELGFAVDLFADLQQAIHALITAVRKAVADC